MQRDSQQPERYEHLVQHLNSCAEELKIGRKRYKEALRRRRSMDFEKAVQMMVAATGDRRNKDDAELVKLSEKLEKKEQVVEKEVEEAQEQLEDATEAYEAANREFLIATVEPRVEATKLRFEEHKLRATLSSASIVGIAATSGILLPHSPSYVAVLGVSFCCLFLSTILTLEAMKRTSEYVEGTLIRGSVNNPKRLLAWLTRHTFTAGLIVFAIFVVLNLQF